MNKKVLKLSGIILLAIAIIVGVGYFALFRGANTKTVVENNKIISEEYSLPYFDFGEGDKAFVVLPGSSMTSILNSEDGVKAIFTPYTEDYHFYVFDVPENLDAVSGIDEFADIIADASNALGIKEADVYGASMGGMVAQELAVRHPSLVRSLTLASSMSRNNELSTKVISEWSEISEPEELAKVVNMHVYSEEYYNTYAEVFHALESQATADGVKRMHNLARMMKEFSVYDELDQIKCPVYVFAGSEDNTLGAKASIEIAEKLGCDIEVYDGYSHAVYDEYPGFYDEVFGNLN